MIFSAYIVISESFKMLITTIDLSIARLDRFDNST